MQSIGGGACENHVHSSFEEELLHCQLMAGGLLVVCDVVVVPGRMEIDDQPGRLLTAERCQILLQPFVLWAPRAKIDVAASMDHMCT